MRKKPDINTAMKVVVRELKETQNRVVRLERKNRLLAMVSIICLLGFFLLAYALFTPHKTITANQFVLTGEEGEFRVIIGPSAITLLDPNQIMRARLGISVDGSPSLTFYDNEQKIRASYSLIEQGIPRISLYDRLENCRGHIGLNPQGRMVITLYDALGEKIETFGLYPQDWVEEIEAGAVHSATP